MLGKQNTSSHKERKVGLSLHWEAKKIYNNPIDSITGLSGLVKYLRR
jgi:hypothetical protein